MSLAGLVLAGGRSRRMGEDKAFLALGGETLLARAVRWLAPQVERLWISANGEPSRHAGTGLPVLKDAVPGFAGPLAGVLAGLVTARSEGFDRLLTAAVDTPFFPHELAARLSDGAAGEIAVAASAGRTHPVFALWPVALADELSATLAAGSNKAMAFIARHPHRIVDFDIGGGDPFFNINTPEDLALAEARLAGSP